MWVSHYTDCAQTRNCSSLPLSLFLLSFSSLSSILPQTHASMLTRGNTANCTSTVKIQTLEIFVFQNILLYTEIFLL